jgi:hypothetical protein
MGEYLGSRPARGLSGQRDGQLGRRAQLGQCRADLALAVVEALPDALPGSTTEMAAGDLAGDADASSLLKKDSAPLTGMVIYWRC